MRGRLVCCDGRLDFRRFGSGQSCGEGWDLRDKGLVFSNLQSCSLARSRRSASLHASLRASLDGELVAGGRGGWRSGQVAAGGRLVTGCSCWQGGNGGKLTVAVATLAIGGNERARLQVQAHCRLAVSMSGFFAPLGFFLPHPGFSSSFKFKSRGFALALGF